MQTAPERGRPRNDPSVTTAHSATPDPSRPETRPRAIQLETANSVTLRILASRPETRPRAFPTPHHSPTRHSGRHDPKPSGGSHQFAGATGRATDAACRHRDSHEAAAARGQGHHIPEGSPATPATTLLTQYPVRRGQYIQKPNRLLLIFFDEVLARQSPANPLDAIRELRRCGDHHTPDRFHPSQRRIDRRQRQVHAIGERILFRNAERRAGLRRHPPFAG